MSQRTDRILSLSGLLIAIAAIVVSVTVPEVRRYFGLDGSGAQPASGGHDPAVAAFQDSAVGPAPAVTSGWTTNSDTDVAPPAPIGAGFAREEPTDTVAVAVTVPTTDTVVESSTTVTTTSFGNRYRQ